MLPNSPILSSLRCCSLHHCEAMHLRSSLEVLLKGLGQRCLGHSADDSVHLGSVLEDHHSGNAADAVLCCNSRALICVELELQQRQAVSVLPHSLLQHTGEDRWAELHCSLYFFMEISELFLQTTALYQMSGPWKDNPDVCMSP